MKTKSKFWCLTFLVALLVSSVPTNSRPQQQSPLKESAVITGVKVGQIGIHTIVRVNGKGHLVFHAERLSNSDRLVLDFKNARLDLAQSTVSSALMPIRGIRVGQFKPDVARVVVDLEAMVPYSIKAEEQSITIVFAPASAAPAETLPNQAALSKRENATAKTRREAVSPSKPEAALNSPGARPSELSAQPIAAGAILGLPAIDAATGYDNGPPRNSVYSPPVQQHDSSIYGLSTSSAQTLTAIAPTDSTPYVLGPDDQIAVRALDVEEMDGKLARVDLRGYIDVPLLGNIKAAGLSVDQLEAQLTERLRKYVQEPRVTVTVSEYRSQPAYDTEHGLSTYALGPGDQVTVSVLDLDEMGKDPYRIDMRGNLTLPMAGSIPVSGLTAEQTADVIRQRLNKYVKNPDVTVRLLEMRSQPVSVLGEVRNPGVIQLMGQKTLFEILSLAGGLNSDAGYVIRITREKQWGKIPLPDAKLDETGEFWIAQVGVKEIINGSSPETNIPVKPNDVITVPKGEIVYVLGAVKRSGGFVLGGREKVTVLQALAMAEGLDRFASTGNAKIVRKTSDVNKPIEIRIDIKKLLQGKTKDIPLTSDDILFVPTSGTKQAIARTAEAGINIGSGIAIWRP